MNQQSVDMLFHSAALQDLTMIHEEVKSSGETLPLDKMKYFLLASMALGQADLMDHYLNEARALALSLDELYELIEVIAVLKGELGLKTTAHLVDMYMASH